MLWLESSRLFAGAFRLLAAKSDPSTASAKSRRIHKPKALDLRNGDPFGYPKVDPKTSDGGMAYDS